MEAVEATEGAEGRQPAAARCIRAACTAYPRYCLSGFIHNFTQYAFWLLIPLVANDLGAEAWQLGVLQMLASGLYTAVSLLSGSFLVERLRTGVLSRLAVTCFIAACTTAVFASRLWVLFAVVTFSACGNAMFWAPVQNAVGREAGPKADTRISLFGVFHALGKSIGFALGGFSKGLLGAAYSFIALLAFDATLLAFTPCGLPPSSASTTAKYVALDPLEDTAGTSPSAEKPTSATPETTPRPSQEITDDLESLASQSPPEHHAVESRMEARNRLFLLLSWVMNFGAYGSMTVVQNQLVKLVVARGIGLPFGKNPGEIFQGVFLCAIYLAQMTIFAIGGAWHKWMYSRLVTYIVELTGVVSFVLIGFVSNAWILLVFAFGCGLMAGTGYLASASYSFHSKTSKSGKLVGFHEAVLSISSVILPPIAGALVTKTGDVRLPYWMCAGLVLAIMGLQETIVHFFWRRFNRKQLEAIRNASSSPVPDFPKEH